MPGQAQETLESLMSVAADAVAAGCGALLLFGVPAEKDAHGSRAWAEDGIVQEAARRLKREWGSAVVVIADLCLDEFTDHGHCGVLRDDGEVDNDATLPLYQRIATSLADAGVDIVAPSGMMDGQVAAIRRALDGSGHAGTPILAYSAKHASAFYGPFRDAGQCAPRSGDRTTYQMDPGNGLEALRETRLDVAEGADMVMVKPALTALDLIRRIRDDVDVPVAAYCVSGEYAMLRAAAAAGAFDEREAVLEAITAIRRAGADVVITYHAREAAGWLS
jgi:porphobilinogen synthase